MTDKILIDRATLEQLVTALEAVLDDSKYANELTVTGGVYEGLQCKEVLTAGRAALANAEQAEPEPKLWLWKNFVDGKQEYWVFDNLYPININDGDPQTLGDPCGYALFKPSRNGRKEQQ